MTRRGARASRCLAVVLTALLAFLLGSGATAAASPSYPPAGYLVDVPNVIPADSQAQIEGELASFQDRTGNQVAVAIVPSLGGDSIESYAATLFNRWGLGERGVNNGVLIVVAVQERRLRVEVGRGLTDILTDAAAGTVVSAMTSEFASGDYTNAVVDGEREVRTILGDTNLDAQAQPAARPFGGGSTGESTGAPSGGLLTVAFLLILGVSLGLALAATRRHRLRPMATLSAG